ncbi:hypothetical protein BRM82_23705, partial [Xanthomonas oryzae pv. oryzae]
EPAADLIGRDKGGIAHGLVLAKCRPNASVVAFSPTAPCAGQLHGSISGHVLARRQPRNAGVCEPLRRNRRVREPLNNAWRCERIWGFA